MRRSVKSVLVVSPRCAAPAAAKPPTPPATSFRRNFGGLPTTTNSLDQLPLYDALTPLRGNISNANINNLLPENFRPIGATHEENTGRPGLRLIYDSYGIPHVRQDARGHGLRRRLDDRARPRPADPARSRAGARGGGRRARHQRVRSTSAQSFVPSPETEALVTRRRTCSSRPTATRAARSWPTPRPTPTASTPTGRPTTSPGARDRQRRDRGHRLHRLDLRRRRRRRGEQLELLGKLKQGLGPVRGYKAWDDLMLAEDPEAPTTIKKFFNYPVLTGGARSARWSSTPARSSRSTRARRRRRRPRRTRVIVDAAAAPPGRQASNQVAAAALGDRQLARHDGPAARLLLPRDRPADRPARPRHQGAGRGRARPGDVHPDRAHEGLRLEPDLGQPRRARRSPSGSATPTARRPRAPPRTTSTRASARRSRTSTPGR